MEENKESKEIIENKKDEYCIDEIKNIILKELGQFSNTELNVDELDILYKLVDIYKDLENVDYWKIKEEFMDMRYSNYGDYDEGRYGNYGNYGRRGVPGTGRGRYRGHDEGHEMIEDMKESYSAYRDSMNAYNRGNYNAGQDGMKALEDTMEIFTEFTEKMIRENDSPEAKQIIKKYLRKVGQMGGM